MTDGSRAGESRDISALLGVLRRRGWIVVLCIGVAAGAAYLYAKQQDRQYEASANLLLRDPPPGPNNIPLGTPTPNTGPDREALVLSQPIKVRAEKALASDLGGRAQAAASVADASAFSAAESDVVRITGKAATGARAALVANTIAQQNIAFRKARSLGRIRRARRAAQRSLRELGPPGTTPQEIATRNAAANQIRTYLQALTQAASAQEGDAEILQRATASSSPASPKPMRSAIIGAFAGLLLGFAFAVVREQLDRRLRGAQDLTDTLELPILASVPTSRAIANRTGQGVDALPPAEREAFQMLRANLRFLDTDKELRSVVVTSAASGDGKTTVALNLAMADASVGRNVLLIEADMRRPSIAKSLGLKGKGGLASYLASPQTKLAEVIHRVSVTQGVNGNAGLAMDVIVSGAIPANPSELINSDRMRDLIAEAERDYDLVVLDTSPVAIVADAIPLMSEASAVIVVSRVGRITGGEASALRDQLKRIDAPAFGLVANFTAARDKGYGYY
jgi:capsular exopolysaccharide synthesis family protein